MATTDRKNRTALPVTHTRPAINHAPLTASARETGAFILALHATGTLNFKHLNPRLWPNTAPPTQQNGRQTEPDVQTRADLAPCQPW